MKTMTFVNTFFTFFPPPHFLTMPAVGLTISDCSIKFAELKKKKANFTVTRYGEKKIPRDVVVGGIIQNKDALKNILAQIKKEQKFTFVHMSLPEQLGYVLKLLPATTKKKELRGSIEFQIEEHVPLDPHNTVFDYTPVVCGDKKTDESEVGVSVIPKEVVEGYWDLLDEVGFTPLSFEIEPLAIARALISKNDCGTYMLVDMGATKTGISIISDTIVRFTWTIPIGGDVLTNTVSKVLSLEYEKAKAYKEKVGLMKKGGEEKQVFTALVSVLETIRTEIKKRYDYWHTHIEENEVTQHPPIKKIILCGGEANVPGLSYFFASGFKSEVVLGNPWVNITSLKTHIPQIPFNKSLQYTTALGLAMRPLK